MKNNKKGMILPIALFILVGVVLSSAILIKSTSLINETAGDLGLKNKTSNNNDLITAKAIDWLEINKLSLDYDEEQNGYISSAPNIYPDFTKDETWINSKSFDEDDNGNKGSYIIYRMCDKGNRPYNAIVDGVMNQCAVKNSESEDTTSSIGYDSKNFKGNPQVFFKIVAKTDGLKSSKSISETIVSISQ